MSTLQKINQSIGYYIGKKVSPHAGLKHQASRLLNYFSVLPKGTQQQGDMYGTPQPRNDKSYQV